MFGLYFKKSLSLHPLSLKICGSSSLKDFHKQTSSTRAKFIRTSGKKKRTVNTYIIIGILFFNDPEVQTD